MAARTTQHASFYRRNRWWLVLAAVIAAIVLTASVSSRRTVVQVRAADVTRGDITSTIDTNGTIQPLNNFEAHAPAPTTVKQLLVKEGDRVRRGQLLLVLDNADARAQAAKALAQMRAAQADLHAVETGGTREEVITTEAQLVKARADSATAQRNFQALQRLEKEGAASPSEVEAAANQVKTAQAQVHLLEQKLSKRYSSPEVARVQAQLTEAQAAYAAAQDLLQRSEVRAPREGVVYNLPVHQGNFVQAGELLVQVADLSKVEVLGYVDEPDIGRLNVGEKVNISWDALPGRVWTGTITRVPTTVTHVGTRNVGEVSCVVDNQDMRLLPNVNVSVKIITGEHANALTVPREAVHQDDGRRYLYQIVNGELKRRYIDTGISNLTRIEVTSGVPDGAVVAVSALNSAPLRDGLQVKVATLSR